MRLEVVTPDNFHAAIGVTVRPDQGDLVAPVVQSLAEAYLHPAHAWPRVIYDGEDAVGFVMAFLDTPWPGEGQRSGLWRLNIAADRQGRGYGRFAVAAVADEIRSRGETHLWVSWEPRRGGPEPFYRRLGFRLTGEELYGQSVGVLDLSDGPAASVR
jgi:diamine N-acetyltransferase